MPLYSISPLDIIVSLDKHIVAGYSEGTFIQLIKEDDLYRIKKTADGCISRTKIESKVWMLQLTLAQSSPTNDILFALHYADMNSSGARFAVTIKDVKGSTLFSERQAWIHKLPDVTFGNAVQERTWTICLPYAAVEIGGNSISANQEITEETVFSVVNNG